ncbi:hypothetical protein CNMCM5623_010017 [Aspergillus felis]|uniref:Uncharacterized protein n=1 Tax=Aspergillus felis TaxID=1287682 RepID=A0A8H6Q354_9EURO|nr:hypothetical protein CNMCM5623_010017 [Aspergillus felis]
MMGPFAHYLIPLAIVGAAQAVTVKGYWIAGCHSPGGTLGLCTNIPENQCCIFTPEAHPFSFFTGNTRSVEWTRFSECQLLQWWNPNTGNGASPGTADWNCHGTLLDTFTTGTHMSNPRHCMSSSAELPPFGQQRHDGATWKDIIHAIKSHGYDGPYVEASHCSPPKDYGSDLAASVADLTRSMQLPNSAGSMIFGFMSGSRRKRVNEELKRRSAIEIQKSLIKEFYEKPCEGAVYATHFGLTPGMGVWVLEGSKGNHEHLIKASTDASSGWNARLKKAGAVYFDHWAEHPEIRENMMDTGHTFTEKDIRVAKAKRSVGDEPTVDDYIPREISIESRSLPANSQSDETSVDDSFPTVAERSTDILQDDSFPYIAERSTDQPEDDSFLTIAERSTDIPEYDSFSYIAERSTDQPEDDSFPWIQ